MKTTQTNKVKVAALNAEQIEENIHLALTGAGYQTLAKIKVKTVGQNVVLKGTVRSWDERKVIAHAVWSTPGVAMVKDRIVIRPD